MKSVISDARGFVNGVVTQLKQTGSSSPASSRVQSLLLKMSSGARKERQAVVESAVKLTAEEERGIEQVLSTVSGHEVSLETHIDPTLIAGIRIQMADWVMDTSMKSELQNMSTMLLSE